MRMMVPENSEPAIQGRAGWCWYLPRIWRRSKKLVAVAWMAIRYSEGEGMRSGTVVTVRSSGPWEVVSSDERDKGWRAGYLHVLLHLDGTHLVMCRGSFGTIECFRRLATKGNW